MTDATTGDNTGAAAAAAAAAATAAAAAAATGSGEKWYAKADPAVIGHIQSHGWSEKKPDEVALAAVQSHFEAQKMLGAPANELLRLPKQNDEAGWKAFYQKLGAPADPKGYDFTTVKNAEGKALEGADLDFVRNQAAALNLTQNAALQLAQSLVKQADAAKSSANAERTAKASDERAELLKNWGPNADANLFIVRRTAEALGVTREQVDALEQMPGMGYAKVMEMFRNIGTKIGEDTFVRATGSTQSNGLMSREQAQAKKQELMSDTAWVNRYTNGGAAELREMTAINTLLAGKAA